VTIVATDSLTESDIPISTGHGGIRCPLCRWAPREGDLWMCSCGYAWNTFDTGGVCPACLRQWTETQCPVCGGWSAHSDWYSPDLQK
jgi:hypothetical protein